MALDLRSLFNVELLLQGPEEKQLLQTNISGDQSPEKQKELYEYKTPRELSSCHKRGAQKALTLIFTASKDQVPF